MNSVFRLGTGVCFARVALRGCVASRVLDSSWTRRWVLRASGVVGKMRGVGTQWKCFLENVRGNDRIVGETAASRNISEMTQSEDISVLRFLNEYEKSSEAEQDITRVTLISKPRVSWT